MFIGGNFQQAGTVAVSSIAAWNQQTTGIDDSAAAVISLYPNPAAESFIVKSRNQKMKTISMYSLQGQQVFENQVNSSEVELQLDARLASGVYILKINFVDGSSYSQRLILE